MWRPRRPLSKIYDHCLFKWEGPGDQGTSFTNEIVQTRGGRCCDCCVVYSDEWYGVPVECGVSSALRKHDLQSWAEDRHLKMFGTSKLFQYNKFRYWLRYLIVETVLCIRFIPVGFCLFRFPKQGILYPVPRVNRYCHKLGVVFQLSVKGTVWYDHLVQGRQDWTQTRSSLRNKLNTSLHVIK